jgi:hypothetical protein
MLIQHFEPRKENAYLDSHLQSFECCDYQTVGGPVREHGEVLRGLLGGHLGQEHGDRERHDRPRLPTRSPPSSTTPIIQQQVAGLASSGQYTFYVWAEGRIQRPEGVHGHRCQPYAG